MITVSELKSRIAELSSEVAAGDSSEEYRECIYFKYEWERQVQYETERLGEYYHGTDEHHLSSADLSAGFSVYTPSWAGYLLEEYGETPPSTAGDIFISGTDKELFYAEWPGIAFTGRPLPAGEYQFYFNTRPKKYVICDAMPEAEQKRDEHHVHVTSPAGTLHEAFFDPVAIGTAVGTDGSNGALEPASFTVGGAASALQGIEWQGGAVVLTLSPYASLTGHALDFIALDGTAVLTLSANAATVDAAAGTLSWTVATQPWSVGDQLMLRIRESAETVTPTSTATATPEPYGPPTVRCPSAGAQAGAVEGAGAETTGSSGVYIAASTGSTLAQGACSEVILTVVSGSDKHRQLDVALNATEHLAFDAGCAQRQKSWSGLSGSNLYQWRTPLYACSPGAGTLTSTLTYSDSGATAATDTDTVTVPTATPTSTPTPAATSTPAPVEPTATPTPAATSTPAPVEPTATPTPTPVTETAYFYPTSDTHTGGLIIGSGCSGGTFWGCLGETQSGDDKSIVHLANGGVLRLGFTVGSGDVPGTVTDVRFEVRASTQSGTLEPGEYGYAVYSGGDAVAEASGQLALSTDWADETVSGAKITSGLSGSLSGAEFQIDGPAGSTMMRVTRLRMVVEYAVASPPPATPTP